MSDRIFVDTNILIYAHDIDAATKHERARELVASLWDQRTGILSSQVLQEFYVTVTKKIPSPLTRLDARMIIRNYLPWVVDTDPGVILTASEIEERNHLSFWDALIVAAAAGAGATKILTEDLNHGQRIQGVLIENPFR